MSVKAEIDEAGLISDYNNGVKWYDLERKYGVKKSFIYEVLQTHRHNKQVQVSGQTLNIKKALQNLGRLNLWQTAVGNNADKVQYHAEFHPHIPHNRHVIDSNRSLELLIRVIHSRYMEGDWS